MRRTRILTAVLARAAGLLAGSPSALAADANAPNVALAADTCTWHSARIDGGGFVPGVVFNRSEKNLAYARSDFGGAYRWQVSTKTWTPLLDSVGWDEWGRAQVGRPGRESAEDRSAVQARREHAGARYG